MVSFWPWKGGEDAAAFEKTLSNLAVRISKATARNDALRQRSRKLKVMWTLYTIFAWILATTILTVVIGWRNWGPTEYTGVAGGPLVIYGVRQALTAYYNYRITNTQASLNRLHKEQDATIERLKAATKYNSTQQLLDKYGSQKSTPQTESPPKIEQQKSPDGQQRNGPQPGRTNIAPPPTANIPRASPHQLPEVPSHFPNLTQQGLSRPTSPAISNLGQKGPVDQIIPPTEEFAPNAFSNAEYISGPSYGQPTWYDRLMDALMGEDETQAKNRIALICSKCRLVNGQAPPGTKTLEDVGRWRCGECKAWNGRENEAKKLVQQIAAEAQSQQGVSGVESKEISEANRVLDSDESSGQDDGVEAERDTPELSDEALSIKAESTPAMSTRSKARRRKK
ncbi:hypothetical protein M501DRAFT_994366 [Patellaria atrata CBS 101060]|uniref:Endoplasmic reticulum junction formation protein lunapark n=1 Tax=Patellaria atrata CBS 101060 TaxID=1346257 RepID=A0A9P4SJJ2_9PEZI|nr:hypothetical protein M501DRAFT_994366 [Patellaria atrata CBS 101060]